ncbi:hypothetical protein CVT24_012608 [Panaeolus cyanescens]|uniref:Uncharacterized protein n=1 Tax=Panaeolus cyanescens TaxID=181874 RepID=A0A409YL36_9AGAR|nr:hypothetical protein CVT24_012608 [Panaeolus cyanescens]
MKLSISLFILSSILSSFGAPTPAAKVVEDINRIKGQVNSLDNQIQNLRPGDSQGAWNIHTSAREVISSLQSATEDAKVANSQPISSQEAQEVLTATEGLRDAVVKAMADLVEKKDIISHIPVPGSTAVVRQDLKDTKVSAQKFQQAMLSGSHISSRSRTRIKSTTMKLSISLIILSSILSCFAMPVEKVVAGSDQTTAPRNQIQDFHSADLANAWATHGIQFVKSMDNLAGKKRGAIHRDETNVPGLAAVVRQDLKGMKVGAQDDVRAAHHVYGGHHHTSLIEEAAEAVDSTVANIL